MIEKKRRNGQIVAMWDSGCSQSEIARTFNITPYRVHQIVDRYKRRKQLEQDSMYSAFMDSAKRLGKTEASAYRAFHQLTLKGCRTMFRLSKLTDEDILKMRNIGVGSLEIINDAKAHAELRGDA